VGNYRESAAKGFPLDNRRQTSDTSRQEW